MRMRAPNSGFVERPTGLKLPPYLAIALCASLSLAACKQPERTENDLPVTPTTIETVGANEVDDAYLADPGDGTDWPATGFSYANRHFSPLDEINASNVSQLGIAWSVPLTNVTGTTAAPIAVDGRLYVPTGDGRVYSYDGTTGKRIWQFEPTEPLVAVDNPDCRSGREHGLALWKGRVLTTTPDGRIVALDANTGALLWSTPVSENGSLAPSGTPQVFDNHVAVGLAPSCRTATDATGPEAARGSVAAYRINDGQLAWQFFTTPPANGEIDDSTAGENASISSTLLRSWPQIGDRPGGFVHGDLIYDSGSQQLIFGTGPGSRAHDGDALFLSSLVAVDAKSGEYRWHYQVDPGGRDGQAATGPHFLASIRPPAIASEDEEDSDDSAAKAATKASPRRAASYLVQLLLDGRIFGFSAASGQKGFEVRYAGSEEAGAESEAGPDSGDEGDTSMLSSQWPGHELDAPFAYSVSTGLTYITLPAQRGGDDEEAEAQGGLSAISPATGKSRWSDPRAGRASLVTGGNLVFAELRETFGRGLGIFSADKGKLLYFDARFVPRGGISTFRIGGVQHIAFVASRPGGTARLVVLRLGSAGKKAAKQPGKTAERGASKDAGDQ